MADDPESIDMSQCSATCRDDFMEINLMFHDDEFDGSVFNEKLNGGQSGCRIRLNSNSVIAVCSDGSEFSVPFQGCVLEIGGASGQMIFCRTRDRSVTISCENPSLLNLLEQTGNSTLVEQIDTLRRRMRADRSRRRFWLVILVVFALTVVVGGYFGLIALARATVSALPVSVDLQIGKLALESALADQQELQTPIVVEAVKTIVKRLEPHADLNGLDFEVHVVEASDVNAYCLPGGKIVVHTGLLRKAISAEQVAGVLSHEMAHATRRHGLQRLSESIGLMTAVEILVGDVGGLTSLGVELAKTVAITKSSRQQEAEADRVGVQMLHAAMIDPLEFASFFEMLETEEAGVMNVVPWLSTHPHHRERSTAIRSQRKDLSPTRYVPIDVNWERVRDELR